MRLIEVVRGLGVGGAERILWQRLQFAPTEVDFVVLDMAPDTSPLDVASRIERVREGTEYLRASSSRDLRHLLGTYEPDIVTTRTPRDLLLLAPFPARSRQFGWVHEAHSTVLSESAQSSAMLRIPVRLANKRPDLHVAVSAEVAAGPQCRGAQCVAVHYFGSTLATSPKTYFSENGGPTGGARVRILVLGRLSPIKRPLDIISAVSLVKNELRDAGGEVRFVGGGELLGEGRNLARRLGVEDLISFSGPVMDPSRELLEADVLLCASRGEGLPLSVFEAKLAGLRLVSTRVGGIPEVAEPHDRLLPDFSIDALALGILTEARIGRDLAKVRLARIERGERFDSRYTQAPYFSLLKRVSALRRPSIDQ